MAKYFVSDTPLAELERVMMSIPRFTPRHSGVMVLCRFHYQPQDVDCGLCTQYQRKRCAARACPWLPERLEAGAVGYGELVAECFRDLGCPALSQRIAAVTAGKSSLSYGGLGHRQRMDYWQRNNGPRCAKCVRSRWLAALFLLASSEKLWARTWSAVTWNGIDFSKVSLRDIDTQDYAVYQMARSLFTGKLRITAEELADKELVSDGTLRLVIDAALIARHGRTMLSAELEAAPC